MAQASTTERRRKRRAQKNNSEVKLIFSASDGESRYLLAEVVDQGEGGAGLLVSEPMAVGLPLIVNGLSAQPASIRAQVAWCKEHRKGCCQVGILFDPPPQAEEERRDPEQTPNQVEKDHYETLQLSPTADFDTIHRVYRILAQRYHPDNRDTGSEEMFRQILEAYRVISDPEKRAAYDLGNEARRQARWKIFDQPKAALGAEGEKRKRQGVLALLYAAKVNAPHNSGVTIQELETLLGCPREHLEFSLWYLKENGLLARTDHGRYSITAKGVDSAEASGAADLRADRLLPAAPAGE